MQSPKRSVQLHDGSFGYAEVIAIKVRLNVSEHTCKIDKHHYQFRPTCLITVTVTCNVLTALSRWPHLALSVM